MPTIKKDAFDKFFDEQFELIKKGKLSTKEILEVALTVLITEKYLFGKAKNEKIVKKNENKKEISDNGIIVLPDVIENAD